MGDQRRVDEKNHPGQLRCGKNPHVSGEPMKGKKR